MASELAAALAAFQAELPEIVKGAKGKIEGTSEKTGRQFSFEYDYADLGPMSKTVLRLLGSHGLAWTAKPTMDEGGFVLHYALKHGASGETDEGDWPLPDPVRFDIKKIGGVITYARRYCLMAVTGVAPLGDDQDAQGLDGVRPQRRERPPVRPPSELPRNQDGSLSRSQATDEELAAAGAMTSEQQKEHTALRRGAATGKAPGVEHGPLADDPWASALPPEEQPGSIGEEQMKNLQRVLSKLFTKDERDQRLKAAEQIIDRELTGPHEGRTSKNLSIIEARKLIDTLDGVSRDDLIERLALATGSAS